MLWPGAFEERYFRTHRDTSDRALRLGCKVARSSQGSVQLKSAEAPNHHRIIIAVPSRAADRVVAGGRAALGAVVWWYSRRGVEQRRGPRPQAGVLYRVRDLAVFVSQRRK